MRSGRCTACASPTGTTCKYAQRDSVGSLQAAKGSRGSSYLGLDAGSDCPSRDQLGGGAYTGWANADGSVVIGSGACAGHSRFGIFRGGKFTPLPALPVSLPVPTGTMEGTVAW